MPELETRDLRGVEIFDVGTWNGRQWTDQDLDEMVANFGALRGVVDPPAKLGHSDQQELLEREGYPAAGWVEALYRDGTKLVADFARVPRKVADLIAAGAYRKVSSEIFLTLTVGEQIFHHVLAGVAFLGEELPAVKTLSDIVALYRQNARLAFDEQRDVACIDYATTKQSASVRAKEEHMRQGQLRDLVARIGRAIGLRVDHQLGQDESLEERQRALQAAVDEAFPSGGEYGWAWIVASFDDHVIISRGETYWQVPYTVAADGTIALGQAFEVEQTWSPKQRVTNTDAGASGEEEADMATSKAVLKALGLPDNADESAAVAKIGELTAQAAKFGETETRVATLEQTLAKNAAETAVDQAIRDRKLPPAKRDWAIAFAMKDLAGFSALVKDAPELFSGEHGSSSDAPPPTTVGAQINELITKAMQADPKLAFADAMSKVAREHPDLIAKYREESRAASAASARS